MEGRDDVRSQRHIKSIHTKIDLHDQFSMHTIYINVK